MSTTDLLRVLDVSIKRNGADRPLTLGHLRNLLALADRRDKTRVEAREEYMERLADECTGLNG